MPPIRRGNKVKLSGNSLLPWRPTSGKKKVSATFLKHLFIYLSIYLSIYLCIYLSLRWVFAAARGLSLVVESRGYSLLQCAGFSLWWLLLLRSTGSRCPGFSSYGTQAQELWLTGSRAQAQKLWRTGLAAPWHVGSS